MGRKKNQSFHQQQARLNRRAQRTQLQKKKSAIYQKILLSVLLVAALACAVWLPQFVQSSSAPAEAIAPAENAAPLSAHDGITAQEAARLDALCADLPASLSLYVMDLDSGDVYTNAADDAVYYCASLLKAPYALWLCRQADAGQLDLSGSIPYPEHLWTDFGRLSQYTGQDSVPTQEALGAMIVNSDNNATTLLAEQWPATDAFRTFLAQELGFSAPESCQITSEGISGSVTAADMGAVLNALYDYFESGADHALMLKALFLGADHNILYVPTGTAAAKKYGSWTDAFHDMAIVYAPHPYLVAALTSWGSSEVDYPPEAVEQMQEIGQLVWQVTQDEETAPAASAAPAL